jgi:hypothetical protein
MTIDAESFMSPVKCKLLRKLLACRKAAVETEKFHQIDDRRSSIKLLLVLRSEAAEHRCNFDRR